MVFENTMVMEEQGLDMELASENIPVPQVQEEVKVDTIKRTNKSSSKPRLRKKALHATILKQMEFYFSDANLSKDRFLSKLLQQDPYVDLAVFTTFNKLSELNVDTNRIAKALQKSTLLKVSEDGTKVCRLTPINRKENVDICTVYVQNLPPDADHDWLISIFSKFGLVEYVSIPRYKSNRKIKGFAFVEFNTPNSAQECIKAFQKKGCVLPYNVAPHDVLSISTFDEIDKSGHSDSRYNANSETKLEDIKKENASEDDKNDENNENMHDNEINIADINDKQHPKKRKLIPEKPFTTNESAEVIKIKKKRRETVDHNITDQQNEKEESTKDTTDDNNKTWDNETDVVNNSNRQSAKKKKLTSEKLSVTESDTNIGITEDSNTENHEIPNKISRNKITEKKKRKDHSITDQQNEKKKTLKDEIEDNDKTCDNETDVANNSNKQSAKKRKLTSERLSATESDINNDITENSNTENEENPNKSSRNKITEKKKRKLSIYDTNIVEDSSGEVKKESHKSAAKSNKNKGTKSVYLNASDDDKVRSNEAHDKLKTEKHSMTRDSGMTNSDIEETSVDEKKKKKNRKKRNKIQEDDICYALGLQVMAKPDWKRLRNKYLELQKAKMQQLKGHLRKSETITGKKGYHDTYGQNYKSKNEKENGKDNETEKSPYGRTNYTPGIIVKIEMDEPCIDPYSFKMELKDNNSVKYIDVTHGSCEAYVRCDTAEAAQSFVQKNYEGRCLTILKDDDEMAYWDKIARDREEQLNRKGKVQRGRDKLLKRAEKKLGKCIKFDQD